MKYTIPVSNLNNSIRFYNRLSGSRPDIIGYDYAYYSMDGIRLELKEIFEKPAIGKKLNYPLPEEREYDEIFNRVRHLSRWRPGLDCQVVEDFFTIKDPDEHLWVISKGRLGEDELGLISESDSCYVERFI